MTVREQIRKMPMNELSQLVNSRNDEQTNQIRAAWIAWYDTQAKPPATRRLAWYGFQVYRQSLPPGSQL